MSDDDAKLGVTVLDMILVEFSDHALRNFILQPQILQHVNSHREYMLAQKSALHSFTWTRDSVSHSEKS